jgi:hypothetical protein
VASRNIAPASFAAFPVEPAFLPSKQALCSQQPEHYPNLSFFPSSYSQHPVPLQIINIVNLNKALPSTSDIYQKKEHRKINKKTLGGRGGI